MATAQEKFDAAVKVIHSLPKDGAFQPSHAMMLKFYGYYKQATLGPNRQPKPAFWEVVKKAKWEAWKALGELSSDEAMESYVMELKKVCQEHQEHILADKDEIIETMPHTHSVEGFMDTIGTFYEMVDLKMPANGVAVKQQDEINGNDIPDPPYSNHSTPMEESEDDSDLEVLQTTSSEDLVVVSKPKKLGWKDEDDPPEKLTRDSGNYSEEHSSDSTDGALVQNNSHMLFNQSQGDALIHTQNNGIPTKVVKLGGPESNDEEKDKDDDGERKDENGLVLPQMNGHSLAMHGIPDHVTSESESDSEFCDTTDQPILEESLINRSESSLSSQSCSTPNKSALNATNSLIVTEADVHMGRISPIDSTNQQSDIPTNGLLSQTLPEPSGSLLSRTSTSSSPTRTPLSSNSRSNLSVLPSVGSPQKNHVLENSTSSHSKGAPHADENSHQVAPLSESSSSNSHQVVPVSGANASSSSPRALLLRTNGSSWSSAVGTEQFCDGEETKTTPVSTRGGGEVTGGNRQGGARQRSSDSTGSLRRSRGGAAPPGRQELVPGRGGAGGSGGEDERPQEQFAGDVNAQIALALMRLQQDMSSVLSRLNTLETLTLVQTQVRSRQAEDESNRHQMPSWWPFSSLSGRTVLFILLWPFIANWIIRYINRRRRR